MGSTGSDPSELKKKPQQLAKVPATRKHRARSQHSEGERTRNCLRMRVRTLSALGVSVLKSPQQNAAHGHIGKVLLKSHFVTLCGALTSTQRAV